MTSKFKKGDKVTAPYYSWADGLVGEVTQVEDDHQDHNGKTVIAVNLDGDEGRLFYEEELELEEVAKPVTFRICVGTTMGTTEYKSVEAAKDAALLHGNTDEQFTIFEVCEIASFRVNVQKTLVETF